MLTGTTEFKDDKLPPGSPIRPRRYVLLLDLVKKRYRLEGSEDVIYNLGDEDTGPREYHTRISTSAYDGAALQGLHHKKANGINDDRVGDLYIGKGNLGQNAQLGGELCPIFFAHGIVPSTRSPLFVDKWPLTHDFDEFEVAERQILGGQNCLFVQTKPFPGMGTGSSEFWINPAQKSAILRWICLINGSEPWSRLDISWKNTAYGWWVDKWSETSYVNGHVRRICRLRVESFEANPKIPDSDFTLPAEPGWKVIVSEGPSPGKGLDPSRAASTTYVISPSGTWKEISAKGFTTSEGKELPPEGHRRGVVWTIGGGVALAVFVFYVLRRRGKKVTL